MASRDRIIADLDSYLDTGKFHDAAPVGLQVEGASRVSAAVCGVSACLALFEEAVRRGAQMVVVHHGMFWNNESRVLKGPLKERIRFLLENDLSLLAYHLPLDAHPVVGNNARIIKSLGAARGGSFGLYKSMPIGFRGRFRAPVPLKKIEDKLSSRFGAGPLVLRGGPDRIRTIGVVSGGAGSIFHDAVEEGLDLYITGEPYEPAQALCREAGVNFIALGHHNSEKAGVTALARRLTSRFKIRAEFVDISNPA